MASEKEGGKVGDFFDLVSGYAFKSSDFIESGVPVIKIKNVKAGQMIYENLSYVSEQFIKSRPDKIIQDGDLLITMSGNRLNGTKETWVGKVAQFRNSETYLLNQRVGILRPKPDIEIERRYFNYALSSDSYQNEFIAIATSSGGQANLSPSQILGAPLSVPPLPEQKAIARILGTLDDKIELNRRMNATLETMARALFQSWFVDFDPVHAKAAGRHPAGMDTQTAALFPDSFQDSELGPIPQGWRLGKLGEVAANLRRGVSVDEIKDTAAYIGLEHMPRRCIALTDWDIAKALESNKSEFKKGEILFGKLRPYFHKVGVAPLDGVCSTDILVISPTRPEWFSFVLGHVSSIELINHTDALSTGTKMPRTKWQDIAGFDVVLPCSDIAAAFTQLVNPFVERIIANIHESRTLATLRDTLLPKLLSGELRTVTDVT